MRSCRPSLPEKSYQRQRAHGPCWRHRRVITVPASSSQGRRRPGSGRGTRVCLPKELGMLANKRMLALGTGAVAVAMTVAACSSGAVQSGGGSTGANGGSVTLNVATVNNGQMKDMEKLKTEYEKANPGTKVNFQVMEEGDLRAAVTADVASGAGQYDIVTIGAYETPQWGSNGWLVDLTPELQSDASYDVNDLLPPVRDVNTFDGKLFAVPFYGESSILMYNKEVLDK